MIIQLRPANTRAALILPGNRLPCTDVSYISISSCNRCSFIFRGPLESINYGHREWRRVGATRGRGPPFATMRNVSVLLSPHAPFARDIFKDTVLIGPRDTFCERFQNSAGKTVFSPARFAFDCCLPGLGCVFNSENFPFCSPFFGMIKVLVWVGTIVMRTCSFSCRAV